MNIVNSNVWLYVWSIL